MYCKMLGMHQQMVDATAERTGRTRVSAAHTISVALQREVNKIEYNELVVTRDKIKKNKRC